MLAVPALAASKPAVSVHALPHVRFACLLKCLVLHARDFVARLTAVPSLRDRLLAIVGLAIVPGDAVPRLHAGVNEERGRKRKSSAEPDPADPKDKTARISGIQVEEDEIASGPFRAPVAKMW